MTEKKPFEIARETLKQITARKLVPTPVNYQTIYNELAGVTVIPPFPADALRDIAQSLPAKTPGQQKQRGLLEYAIDRLNWEGVKTALVAYGGFVPAHSADSAIGSHSTPMPLAGGASAPALTTEFMLQVARLIEYAQPALGDDDPRFVEQTHTLLKAIRQPEVDSSTVKLMLTNYGHRMSFAAEEQLEIKKTLLKLLHMVFENIGDLSLDEQWLKGQMDALMLASKPPLTLRRLDDVERRLKDVIFKQKDAKERAMEAQDEMRRMLATFIERLSDMTRNTGSFQDKLVENARQIEQAKTIAEIAPVLKEVVGATRSMAEQSRTTGDELLAMRKRASVTEAELAKLYKELDRVSAQARHDPLTGALNRKGMDEALERELSSVRRKESALSVSLLDIDNFKTLNDAKGHATGDQALAHLASVARECMRPQDTLARYGGEEFVILMPDTPLDKGVEAMTRLQRELTTRFFLAGADKILITFSAGVAQLTEGETGADAIKRADQAMYLAKRAGKNRVLAA
ncbi:MAG: GGDEF domain-containing protein [Burkholderiales bacterium PBB3]|nr:MAG: GGDEF domain-containing protein [Burkholderiales bacterium PBB3]